MDRVLLIALLATFAADIPAQQSTEHPGPAAAARISADGDPCAPGRLSVPLTLFAAASRALCENPKSRSAWAAIQLNAAEVRISKEAYRPTLGAMAKKLDSDTQTLVKNQKELDTSARSAYLNTALSLTWVLFDFGQRRDQLEADRQLLAAAHANLDLTMQQVFLQTAADYYDAQAAQASLDATVQIEQLTLSSVNAAHVRVEKGVAPLSDELQAETAHAQAVINRVKAEADLNGKRGALCGDMGIDPDQAITLPQADRDVDARANFTQSLQDLIEEAKRNHPSVVVAERELASARAAEKASRAHLFPTISAVGGVSYTNEPLAPSLGSPSIPGSVSNKFYGIEIDVPLSDPLWRRGTLAKAHAQVLAQEEVLYGARQQIAQQVWSSYTALQADLQNLGNSDSLLDSAQKSLQSTQHRYEGGVGNILELLSSQSAYANAQQQRIRALSDWRTARLALAASLGQLNLQSIEADH
jgi:outer membrane protein